MTQPFRDGTVYQSRYISALALAHREEHLSIGSPRLFLTCSSALWGGGMGWARRFVNWKVPPSYSCTDPVELMREQILAWGYPAEETIGLQTAAKISHASVQEEAGDEFSILCCTTAGTGNAARAGKHRQTYSAYQLGTINIFLFLDGRLSAAAMVNAVMTATEAKAAALQDLGIEDAMGTAATGTTSDAIVVAASQSDFFQPMHLFAGTATTLGNAIGRLVYDSVHEAVSTQGEK